MPCAEGGTPLKPMFELVTRKASPLPWIPQAEVSITVGFMMLITRLKGKRCTLNTFALFSFL